MQQTVNFITGNANKLAEVKAILEPAILVTSASHDIEEVQGTLEEVSMAKCRKAADLVSPSVHFSSLQLTNTSSGV
jgi:inosine triphosphate pyrophosphatase